MTQSTQNGFTLIELMIVVAIIGILASISLPAYQDYVKKAHVLEGLSLASASKTAIWDYWASNATFPTDNTSAGLSDTIEGNAVKSVSISGNQVTITFNEKVIDDKTIILKVSEETAGAISWDCKEGTLETKYRPFACR